ncbi:UDP-N-acetylmuramate--L-alanine ligase [Spirochaeta africana]|uniref:UDP-N-acetylmuramate--L-alanine ligase n=1 Tax=Spirochaeta africana (strain ATCC 700263 / DSM 8902 / Z-7692) TaxID=889378 RepID=H9ULR6_SPIAZ|nr:UDP-N-acetylmuramate--L-alanine ligase [Spirochaeta africana]AFG38459.1 UDP-N-acetylmuramate--alanine ligase [Spirochaeta africana DSM 8902]
MLDFADQNVHCVGIKGSGMAALTELMVAAGARVTGSDVPEQFFTDALLEAAGVVPCSGFDARNLPDDCDLVIYSAAYSAETNPELAEARNRGLRCLQYPAALGELSAGIPSLGVAGTHGKTSTTGMLAVVMQHLGLPGSAILGSVVPGLGGRATYRGGMQFLAAETCEYRRHFLEFHPRWAIITNIEADHLDYYRDYNDVAAAFAEYGNRLAAGGSLIYCADDPGAAAVARQVISCRPDLQAIPYGFSAGGAYRITADPVARPGEFALAGMTCGVQLRVPGRHNILNAAAVVAAVHAILDDLGLPAVADTEIAAGLHGFTGTRRRSETIGEAAGILVMDDYGHHPTEIRVTIQGIRELYPQRRLVVDFMPHTFSRTESLWNDFLGCFTAADEVWLHPVFASARETGSKDPVRMGQDLAAQMAAEGAADPKVRFFTTCAEAAAFAAAHLGDGDLLLTMGAGNNYEVGTELLRKLRDTDRGTT